MLRSFGLKELKLPPSAPIPPLTTIKLLEYYVNLDLGIPLGFSQPV